MRLLSANLQAFVTTAQEGTVHAAASRLGLTQTAVTQRLRALERDLSATLFLRSRKGMRLTAEGEAMLRYCQAAESLEGDVLSQLGGLARTSPAFVTLAGPTSVMSARIADQCLSLYGQWPQLHLHFVFTDLEDRVQLVRSGHSTLAVVPPETVPNEMDSKGLKPDRYLLVASARWKGRRLQDILQQERLIDFYASDSTSLRYLAKFGLTASRSRIFVNNNEALVKFFRHGVGFGTLTQEIARPLLESGDLTALNGGASMDDPLALVWYPRPEMPDYLRALVAAIK